MTWCGNCELTYNKNTETYTAKWNGYIGVSKDYNDACKQAEINYCFAKTGKSCTKQTFVPCIIGKPNTPALTTTKPTTTTTNTKPVTTVTTPTKSLTWQEQIGDFLCKHGSWLPIIGVECYAKEKAAEIAKTKKKYPNIDASPDCQIECGNYFTNFSCYYHKWVLGCKGSTSLNDLIGSGTADSKDKDEICAKHCEFFDVFCKSAKLQAGCGGTDSSLLLLGGGALLLLVLIVMK